MSTDTPSSSDATIEREGQRIERHVSARRRNRDGAWRLVDIERRVEDLVDALQRHARRGEAGVEAHQRLNRPDEPHLIGDERDERPHRDRVIDHAHAADEKHGAASGREQQTGHAAGEIGQLGASTSARE